jgi:hypothetical protein
MSHITQCIASIDSIIIVNLLVGIVPWILSRHHMLNCRYIQKNAVLKTGNDKDKIGKLFISAHFREFLSSFLRFLNVVASLSRPNDVTIMGLGSKNEHDV